MSFTDPTEIGPGSITEAELADGAVTGSKIAADAIDGKVITGAHIRTAAGGQRTEMDGDIGNGEVRFFSGAAAETNPGGISSGLDAGKVVDLSSLSMSSGSVHSTGGDGFPAAVNLTAQDPDDASSAPGVDLYGAVRFIGWGNPRNIPGQGGGTNVRPVAGMDSGRFDGNADASSQVTIPHGLNTTPAVVQISTALSQIVRVYSRTATAIVVECRNAATGALIGSGGHVNVDWCVFA